MIYLDNGATSFHKPLSVHRAVSKALKECANPGRGGHQPSMRAAETVFSCRERVGTFFHCLPEHVVFTNNCTHGLNIALQSVVKPGDRVVISGFEHNAVVRPLCGIGAEIAIAGRKLFDKNEMLTAFEDVLKTGADAAVFTHISNVFGYILPVEEMAQLCRHYRVPYVIDAAQSAGKLPIDFEKLGAEFVAMPGHKGLLGPMGTGILLCRDTASPLLFGGTGSASKSRYMPEELPERLEAGTMNVPGIAGLDAGIAYLQNTGIRRIHEGEKKQARRCADGLQKMGLRVYAGVDQSGTVSFVPDGDCEVFAQRLAGNGIAVRSGLHCAPVAHESAGTLNSGTVRISFGLDASNEQTDHLLATVRKVVNS